jgi:small-conductance mechanosensitive channel
VALIADQPVNVGDFCRFGDSVGTVEDIGMRSTRLRTLERTVVSVPNAQFSSMGLENFGKRDRFWFRPAIGLRYETTPDQIRFVERSGTGFAFPSQTLYLARDSGLDREKSRTAKEQVEDWRRKQELQLPAFTAERIAALSATIQYPPPGSANNRSRT